MSHTIQLEFSNQEWEELERASQVYQVTPARYVHDVAVQDARGTNIAEDTARDRTVQQALQRQQLRAVRSHLRPRAPGVGPRDSRKLRDATALRISRSEQGIAR